MKPCKRKSTATTGLRIALFLAIAWAAFAAASCRESRCESIRREFDGVLANASDTCVSDEGCALYPVLVNCGGVTDAATAKRLTELHDKYRQEGCPRVIACAPRIAEIPACVNGRCVGRSMRGER